MKLFYKLFFLLLPLLGSAAELSVQRKFEVALLLNDDAQISKIGAQALHSDSDNLDQTTLDIVAEKIVHSVTKENDRLWMDTIAWYINVLNSTSDNRYDAVKAWVIANYRQDKIKKRINKKDLQTKSNDVAGYMLGSIDLEQIKIAIRHIAKTDGEPLIVRQSGIEPLIRALGWFENDIRFANAIELKHEKRQLLDLVFSGGKRAVVGFNEKLNPKWLLLQLDGVEQALKPIKAQLPDDLDQEVYVYLDLLLRQSPVESTLGVRSIFQDARDEPFILDVVAEKLVSSLNNETNNYYVDVIAWYAKCLALNRNGRYKQILEWASTHYTNRKILAHIHNTMKADDAAAAEFYSVGTLLLDDLAIELSTRAVTDRLFERRFSELNELMTLRDTLKLIGAPDHVEDMTVRGGMGVHSYNSLSLQMHYYDYGVIQFSYDAKFKPGWYIRHFMPAAVPVAQVYIGKHKHLANSYLSLRGAALWMAMHPVLNELQHDREMLDVLLRRLLLVSVVENKWEVKALATAVRFMSATGDEQYRQPLQRIYEKTKGSDFGDYVFDAIERLDKTIAKSTTSASKG